MTNTYTVKHYNSKSETTTFSTKADSAEDAIAFISGKYNFNFTRKNQNSEDETVRDNAHMQLNSQGLSGWVAFREDKEKQYYS